MSKKNLDKKNRLRSRTIAFRMSPEEEAELSQRVKLMGYRTKQDYMIEAVLHNEVRAIGNPLMLIQFRQVLSRIEAELLRIRDASDMDEELLTPLRSMQEILIAFETGKASDQSNIVLKKQELDRLLHQSVLSIPHPGHAQDLDINNNHELQEEKEN
ncbi:plasmid mobilization protein [Butyrivibrio sp. INlla14]|uniref:plasmid mobilization protein n=1 Tax=Butyrivibrio sp. INlla14 TaxID=1520808 RepID=UPI000876AD9B|nr:hypothetical protein [Butyrivibrio sp. INlla14]SCY59261.1 hypothetical protein SAMN02910371_02923 [Butyrivibrio sp. INlla14]